MTGLGAALADGTYGLIAGFGLTAISSMLMTYQLWIRIIGGVFLLYLGIKMFFAPARVKANMSDDKSALHALGTTYLLTVSNPATILSFIAVFAGLGLATGAANYAHALILISGIIIGSSIWWLLLSGGVAFILHHRLSPAVMRNINKLSGIVIFAFGILALSPVLVI
jgi:threonine/homoserine/homoserine lactone efflux protein